MSYSRRSTNSSTSYHSSFNMTQSRDQLVRKTSVQSLMADEMVPSMTLMGQTLLILSYFVIAITFPLSLIYCLIVVKEFEKVVIFRLGRLVQGCPKGPGLIFVVPCIDTMVKVDLRTFNFTIPTSEVMLKDSTPVNVEAVVYCRVCCVLVAVTHVEDYGQSTRLMASSIVRKVLGSKILADVLSERATLSTELVAKINDATLGMGIRIERVEIKTLSMTSHLQRAMAVEGVAARDARAMVIFAEGERMASFNLAKAGTQLTPTALQLRFMQSLNTIQHNTDRGSTLLFPIPMRLGIGKGSQS
ncbi:Band 7 protein [Halotydeus destructor]|nr:Band 7 protein [Halotydeus destructor]